VTYLHPVRLHFAGRFRADVSTVNNNRDHFDEDNFSPSFQKPFSDAGDGSNWQPAGTGAWRLLDCEVTRHTRLDGSAATSPADDIVVGFAVREADDRASGKIVDLDADQQGVSMLYGVTIRLVDGDGTVLMRGEYEPAPFFDLRFGRSAGGGDAGAGSYFQSVLTDVTWGDLSESPCLQQLRQASAPGLLSIRFITDGYRMDAQQRGYGRIVGTVGPHLTGEPRTFVLGRHLEVVTGSGPRRRHSQAECIVDKTRRKVLVDVGNVLTMDGDGDFVDLGELTLAAGDGASATTLGALAYQDGPYRSTAGIFELPPGRTLTDAELTAATEQPLRLMLRSQGGAARARFGAERADGFYVRAERFVFRLDRGQSDHTDLFVTRFGVPVANATPQTAAFPFSQEAQSPLPEVVTAAKTDAAGRARLTVTGVDPTNPRGFIDGQVYGIVCWVAEFEPDLNAMINLEANFVSVLMFDPVTVLAEPGWDDVAPIFREYGDLYPRPHGPDPYAVFDGFPSSHPVVNLADFQQVRSFARRIAKALTLPVTHPNHMPVTRDLSGGKRQLLLNWLNNVGADGLPRRERGDADGGVAPGGAAAVPAPGGTTPRYATGDLKINLASLRHSGAPPS
jgi:hypothetical protein